MWMYNVFKLWKTRNCLQIISAKFLWTLQAVSCDVAFSVCIYVGVYLSNSFSSFETKTMPMRIIWPSCFKLLLRKPLLCDWSSLHNFPLISEVNANRAMLSCLLNICIKILLTAIEWTFLTFFFNLVEKSVVCDRQRLGLALILTHLRFYDSRIFKAAPSALIMWTLRLKQVYLWAPSLCLFTV